MLGVVGAVTVGGDTGGVVGVVTPGVAGVVVGGVIDKPGSTPGTVGGMVVLGTAGTSGFRGVGAGAMGSTKRLLSP